LDTPKTDKPLIHVIGMEPEGLRTQSPQYRHFFSTCSLLAGGARHLENLSGPLPDNIEKIVIRSNIDALCKTLKSFSDTPATRETCAIVLASGDPLFYGIGNRLLQNIQAESLRFYPASTLIQRAFALLKEPWDDVRVASFHGRDPDSLIPLFEHEKKIALYTPGSDGPVHILEMLRKMKRTPSSLRVVENIGLSGEKIHVFLPSGLDEIQRTIFSPLNIIVLEIQ
jgi:precorrin-6Y C5,15-methyltransferase (decarboxylating)